MDGTCTLDNDSSKTNAVIDFREIAESAHPSDDNASPKNGATSDDESRTDTANHSTKSPLKIFPELSVSNEGTDQSVDLSDSDDSILFCSDPEVGSLSFCVEKPKDILSEVSDILNSLSDDQRFTECVNYSNSKQILNRELNKHRSSVDLIFTYNVLGILYNKLRELKTYFELLKSDNDKLLEGNQIVEAEHLAYQVQVDSLQKLVDEQREKIRTLSLQLETEIHKLTKEKEHLNGELKSTRKKYEEVVCEKDAAVMRYAKNESELMTIRKEKENLLKRLKATDNERNDLAKRVKSLNAEKTSVSQVLDTKKTELCAAMKEIETLKGELSYKDIKANWVEENLQKDLNRYKEENSLLLAEIRELKNQKSNIMETNNDTQNHDECTEKTNGLKSVEFVICEDDISTNRDTTLDPTDSQLLEYEENFCQKDALLREQCKELESVRSNLKQTESQLESCRSEIDRLKELNDELRQDMESCREREIEMLNFTQKLTAKNVAMQSEYVTLEARKTALEANQAPVEERVKELENQVASLSQLLETEISARAQDIRALTEQIENKTKEFDEVNSKLEEQEAENQSLKHKYSSTIRALTREVQQYRKCKQLDTVEYTSSSDSVCMESRTSSCSSLNEPPQLPKLEPDRQTLIERIVKLQKINAKHSEKIEFLEEHIGQLLDDIKKKNRVIQHYILREQSGALSSNSMDQHKAELSKYGGIMAALYSPKGDNNNGLSLELSLEINRKLQAVLEDIILKNITLKENIETLGKEIERLTNANVPN